MNNSDSNLALIFAFAFITVGALLAYAGDCCLPSLCFVIGAGFGMSGIITRI